MSTIRSKLRCFMVRSARDVAAQALPNWAQIGVSLAQNFYDVFVACPEQEQRALLAAAEQVSASEWASIRGQVAGELCERYAEALDQARAALRQAEIREEQKALQKANIRLEQKALRRAESRKERKGASMTTRSPRSRKPCFIAG